MNKKFSVCVCSGVHDSSSNGVMYPSPHCRTLVRGLRTHDHKIVATKTWARFQVFTEVSISFMDDKINNTWERAKMTNHSHDPDPNAVILCRADGATRAALTAGASTDTVHNVIAQTVAQTPVADRVVLDESRLRRTVYSAKKRARKSNDENEGVYTSLEALVLPPRMLQNSGETILFRDTGAHQDRMLVFGLPRHLQMFEHASCILGDGTFQVTPSLWKQQYSLHAYVRVFSTPVLYFLVPGKTKVLYKELLRINKELAPCVIEKPWLFDFESMVHA